MLTPMLLALLESAKISSAQDHSVMNEAADDDEDEPDTQDQETEETPADDEQPEENTDDNDETDDPSDDNEDDNPDDENNEGEEGSEEDPADDFSFDSDSEEDDGPNPDGLPDPDAMGDDSSTEEEPEEKNLQINILNLTSMNRSILKKKIYNSFQDLRSLVNSQKMLIDEREGNMDPELRAAIIDAFNNLYERLTEYMMYTFQYTNYEENLRNFNIFVKRCHEIVQLSIDDGKHDNKSDKKKSSSTK